MDASHGAVVAAGGAGGASGVQRTDGTMELRVCYDTTTFRSLCSTVLSKGDAVLEIGCSYGRCTAEVATALGDPSRVVGVDTSKETVEAARATYPRLRFERMDVLRTPSDAAALTDELRALTVAAREGAAQHGGVVVLVDIGGNREIEALAVMLPWVREVLRPRLCVCKSETVHDWLSKRGILVGDDATGGPAAVTETDWDDLRATARAAVAARASRRIHPLKQPLRLNEDGVAICRYHNYDAKRGCVRFVDLKKTGETCPLDHVHCHACGEEGHIALDCARGTAWLWAAVKAEDAAAAKE